MRALMAAILALVAMFTNARASDGSIDAAVEAIHAHADTHRMLLLGEFHGTREIPALVGKLAARYAVEGPVQLALEIPRGEQAALDAAMVAPTPVRARRILNARSWWQARDDQHDGRRSEDMLDLVESMRRLRAQGRAVTLLAYDVPADPARVDSTARDRAMAERLRQSYAASPRTRLLVLTGNVHAMLDRPTDAPPQMQVPMGHYLRDLDPVSVRITARTGQSWGCPRPRRCHSLPADGPDARTGPMSREYTFGVVLDRFRVARLIGASLQR